MKVALYIAVPAGCKALIFAGRMAQTRSLAGGPGGGSCAAGCLFRIANAQAQDVKRLCARGVLSAAGVKAEGCQVAGPPPVWFVFSGAAYADPLLTAIEYVLCCPRNTLSAFFLIGLAEPQKHMFSCLSSLFGNFIFFLYCPSLGWAAL